MFSDWALAGTLLGMSAQEQQYLHYPIRSNKFSFNVQVKEHLCSRKTPFQQIDIYDTECFGKMLTLDGHIQLATLDEHIYHECLVHIPLLSVESPRFALVVGGGDGGVLREIVKHPTIERVDMVEIDEQVVSTAKEYLTELNASAFDNPKVNLQIADAFQFIKSAEAGKYDLIIMDITDTYEDEEGELSESLFTDSFHNDLKTALSPQGFLVSQADNPTFCPYSRDAMLSTLSGLFPATGEYQAVVPSFGGLSAYVWASHGPTLASDWPTERAKGLDLSYLNAAQYGFCLQNLDLAKRLV